jgi:hypothetical protein
MSSKTLLLVLSLILTHAVVSAQKVDDAPRTAAPQAPRFYADDPIWRDPDSQDTPPVEELDLSKSYEFVVHSFSDPGKSDGPSLNVNSIGEVPDSSWFTNRIGRDTMSIADVVKGPGGEGPAPGVWLVTGRPDEGITPKFTIRDPRGVTYMIKLDPAAFPELPSSVEVISTKIFHALGYHVPDDTIVHLDLSQIQIAPGATVRNASGVRRPIERADLERWLRDQPREKDGTIRALASRFVPGKVVGQFRFTGTRSDDPNDIFPHERRRELRGLRVFAAWLNHDDARSINSIDTLVAEEGRRYIRHYLQDFGSNLGSGSTSAQQPRAGYEYLIETDGIGKGLLGFGFWTREWTRVKYPSHSSLGNVEAEFFEPWKWKTEYPNPAFVRMDAADAFWAASLVSRFTDEMIRAIVETGELSNPLAARVLGDIIIKRRDKVVAYWLTRTNPVDRFRIDAGAAAPRLVFDNAAVRQQLIDPVAIYNVRWYSLDNLTGAEAPVGAEMSSAIPAATVPADAWGPADPNGARYAVARIETVHHRFAHWQMPVVVTIRDRHGVRDVVGVEREVTP